MDMNKRPSLRDGLEQIAEGDGAAADIALDTLSANPQDDAYRAAAALIEWCRRQADDALGSVGVRERFTVKALLQEFDNANALEAFGDIVGAGEMSGETMRFVYRNYRGEISMREVRTPVVTFYGSNDYHPLPQWLVRAYDIEKEDYRDFALSDMRFPHQLYERTDR